jgi:hypothetical protein
MKNVFRFLLAWVRVVLWRKDSVTSLALVLGFDPTRKDKGENADAVFNVECWLQSAIVAKSWEFDQVNHEIVMSHSGADRSVWKIPLRWYDSVLSRILDLVICARGLRFLTKTIQKGLIS